MVSRNCGFGSGQPRTRNFELCQIKRESCSCSLDQGFFFPQADKTDGFSKPAGTQNFFHQVQTTIRQSCPYRRSDSAHRGCLPAWVGLQPAIGMRICLRPRSTCLRCPLTRRPAGRGCSTSPGGQEISVHQSSIGSPRCPRVAVSPGPPAENQGPPGVWSQTDPSRDNQRQISRRFAADEILPPAFRCKRADHAHDHWMQFRCTRGETPFLSGLAQIQADTLNFFVTRKWTLRFPSFRRAILLSAKFQYQGPEQRRHPESPLSSGPRSLNRAAAVPPP